MLTGDDSSEIKVRAVAAGADFISISSGPEWCVVKKPMSADEIERIVASISMALKTATRATGKRQRLSTFFKASGKSIYI